MHSRAVSGLPKIMQALVCTQVGGPEHLALAERPVPMPKAGELLIKVQCAGLNRPDIIQRQGKYAPPEGTSDIMGLELAGTVVALGDGVDAPMLGQQVCALVSGGAHAEYAIADRRHCLPVPDGLSMEEAAAMPETLFTVWHNLFERGYARDGETLLIHGGTSGIGTMAISLCKIFGIHTIVTCGSDEKCAAALKFGADEAINYKNTAFETAARALTGGKGVNIVLDLVGGDYLPRNMAALADDGRCVTIAVAGGLKANISVWDMMARRLTLTGSTLRARSDDFKALLAQEIAAYAWPMVAEGTLRPVMDSAFPLHEAAKAHAHMEAGAHMGKIVLKVA